MSCGFWSGDRSRLVECLAPRTLSLPNLMQVFVKRDVTCLYRHRPAHTVPCYVVRFWREFRVDLARLVELRGLSPSHPPPQLELFPKFLFHSCGISRKWLAQYCR